MRLMLVPFILAAIVCLPQTGAFAQTGAPEAAAVSTAETPQVEKENDKRKKRKYSDTDRVRDFFAAVHAGDTAKAARLVDPMDYYKLNESGESALTQAIQNNDVTMTAFLEERAVINFKNQAGETPLTLAIKKGNPEIIQFILKRGKAALKNDADETPLMLALNKGDLTLAQALIDNGADVNRKSKGITPIAQAVTDNNVKAVALLIRNGADPSQANDDGDIPLYIAVRSGYNVIAGILLYKSNKPEKDANWKTDMGETLLNIAIEQEYDQVVRILLDFGADPNLEDFMENTGLNIASGKGKTELALLLLDHGADPNHANITGETPVTAAAQNGFKDLATTLTAHGANPGRRNFEGFAAVDFGIHEAAITDPSLINEVLDATRQ